MNAKKVILTCLAIFCAAVFFNIKAEQTRQSTFTLKKAVRSSQNKRPKAPDRQVIIGGYDGEQLSLSFLYSEGTATLSVTDETLLTSIYQIDTTPLEISVSVGELFGTVYIEMETENGNNYEGTIN